MSLDNVLELLTHSGRDILARDDVSNPRSL